jgi:hypothetical protein
MRCHFTAKHQRCIGNICVDHKAFTVIGGQKTGEKLGGGADAAFNSTFRASFQPEVVYFLIVDLVAVCNSSSWGLSSCLVSQLMRSMNRMPCK